MKNPKTADKRFKCYSDFWKPKKRWENSENLLKQLRNIEKMSCKRLGEDQCSHLLFLATFLLCLTSILGDSNGPRPKTLKNWNQRKFWAPPAFKSSSPGSIPFLCSFLNARVPSFAHSCQSIARSHFFQAFFGFLRLFQLIPRLVCVVFCKGAVQHYFLVPGWLLFVLNDALAAHDSIF